MSEHQTQPRRRGRVLVGLATLVLLIGIAAAMVLMFQVGVLTGLGIAGGGLVVYAVPAAICGWPLPSIHDVLAAIGGIFGAIMAAILSIFE